VISAQNVISDSNVGEINRLLAVPEKDRAPSDKWRLYYLMVKRYGVHYSKHGFLAHQRLVEGDDPIEARPSIQDFLAAAAERRNYIEEYNRQEQKGKAISSAKFYEELQTRDDELLRTAEAARDEVFRNYLLQGDKEKEEDNRDASPTKKRPSPTNKETPEQGRWADDPNIFEVDERDEEQPQRKVVKTSPEPLALTRTKEEMCAILQTALRYVDDFVRMLSTELGETDLRSHYRFPDDKANNTLDFRRNPLRMAATTIEEFVRQNAHMGAHVLHMAVTRYQIHLKEATQAAAAAATQAPIDVQLGFGIFRSTDVDVRLDNLVESVVRDNVFVAGVETDWLFGAMDYAVFASVLNGDTWGALQLAYDHIQSDKSVPRFSLKQLLMSPDVRPKFVFLVTLFFQMGSGSNAYVRQQNVRRGRAPQTNAVFSAGVWTQTERNTALLAARAYFRRVFRVSNPRWLEAKRLVEAGRLEMQTVDVPDGRDLLRVAVWIQNIQQTQQGVHQRIAAFAQTMLNPRGPLGAPGAPLEAFERAYMEAALNVEVLEAQLASIPQFLLSHPGD